MNSSFITVQQGVILGSKSGIKAIPKKEPKTEEIDRPKPEKKKSKEK